MPESTFLWHSHSWMCSHVSLAFFRHPDRSGPIFSSAPQFGASGRAVEGPRQPTISKDFFSVLSAFRASWRLSPQRNRSPRLPHRPTLRPPGFHGNHHQRRPPPLRLHLHLALTPEGPPRPKIRKAYPMCAPLCPCRARLPRRAALLPLLSVLCVKFSSLQLLPKKQMARQFQRATQILFF